ncbi:MAG: histidine triad nucleotide-binding protein [Firmicutes bacterium]|nr:histidine triad nucleotide-binding protein [Bacillota bacterium]
MENCVFCKIINGTIPSEKIYEDDVFIIFRDINPISNIHYLAVPKAHYSQIEEMNADDEKNLGKIFSTISFLKEKLNLTNGYRLVINQGKDAGQTVFHLHIHILAGQEMDFKV